MPMPDLLFAVLEIPDLLWEVVFEFAIESSVTDSIEELCDHDIRMKDRFVCFAPRQR